MARDGSGTYTLAAGNPVVTGTTISSSTHNTTMTDLETAMTNSIAKNGETVWTGIDDHNGLKIILDADADTSITADTDDVIDFEVGGTDSVKMGWQKVADTGFLTIDPLAFTADTTENTHRVAILATSAITIPSGTTAIVSSIYIIEPNITATGTVTDGATVYIKDAPTEGTFNHAVLIGEGNVTFSDGVAFMKEQAAADTDRAGYGQWWVRNDAPSVPMFTGDTGVDIQLGGAPTKQFIIHCLDRENAFGFTAKSGEFSYVSISSTQQAGLSFQVPHDFASLVDAKMFMIPDATETIQWDQCTDFGAIGEDFNDTEDDLTNVTLGVTAGKITEADVSDGFTGIAAGDWVGFQFKSDTSNLRLVALRVRYT